MTPRLLLLAALLPCSVHAAGPAAQAPAAPGEAELARLLGSASTPFPDAARHPHGTVSERLLDGFEAGPGHLRLADGTTLAWGFKYGEGNLQSVAVRDADGRLRLVATVDDIVRIADDDHALIDTPGAYPELAREAGADPVVDIFVGHAGDLATYLPTLRRWLQADLLGFNVHCAHAAMTRACTLAERIRMPLHAYAAAPHGGQLRALAVPDVPAAQTPLELFVQ